MLLLPYYLDKLAVKVPKRTSIGARVKLVGSTASFGGWDTAQGLKLEKIQSDTWYSEVDVPSGHTVEYKYFTESADGSLESWQSGNNLVLEIPKSAQRMLVTDNWAGNDRVVCVLSEDDYFSNTASDDSDPAPSLESKDILENGALPLRVDDSDAPNTAAGSEAEMITSEASALDGDSTRVADGNRALSSVEETSISKPASGRDAYRKQLLAGLQGSNAMPGLMKKDLQENSKGSGWTESNLKKKTVKELKALLKEQGLPQKGLKAELIQSLLNWQHEEN